MSIIKKLTLTTLSGFALLATLGGPVMAAQDFPSRPLKIIVPYQPGSMVDTMSRKIADSLSKHWHQSVIVENKTGAFGVIAVNTLKAAPADGYVLMADTPAIGINPSVRDVGYDPVKDIEPIAMMMEMPFVVGMSTKVPAKNLHEFIEYGKTHQDKLNLSDGGTSTKLAGLLFSQQTGIQMQQITYKGATPAIMSVLQNECQVLAFDLANMAPQINAGKMIGLITSGSERSPLLPNVPTAKEAGLPDFTVTTWFGLFAKGGTPPEIINKLNREIVGVLSNPEYQAFVSSKGAVIKPYNAAQFKAFFHNDIKVWADIAKKSGVKFN
ncbi:Bug family tripartite tricarboxylate transporter substrate binding protein [Candidimonas nitroreducens]|uniref:ABC transporter substrate-binding protein n=1 Tax=Candidimonas nitroreducens TaxID=683354 RepID=A0A225MS70_9BURK|nr:tripartite tricarboxylate transporter substrate binding protein [Candidimonas nitroreducens]OWT63902.1 hypothetical protein CEY11_06250 [Candidimonas nitroreducens]